VLRPGNPRPAAIRVGTPIPESRSNRESGIPCFPIPAESGIGESPIWPGLGNRGFPPNRESGIPSPIPRENPRVPAKSGIGETGIGDFRVCLCHQLFVSFAPGIIVIT